MTEERLGRMEDKLDKLSEAVVEIARVEERLLTIFKIWNTWMQLSKSMATVWMRLKSKP